jgi:Flp pilus assembly protein CpaB
VIRFDAPDPPLHRRLRRRLARHRRVVAAGLTGTGVWLAASSVVSAVAPPTLDVVVAATDLPAGTVVTAGDLGSRRWPADLVPAGAVTGDDAVGSRLVAPLRAGDPLTDAAVHGAGGAAVGDDRVQVVAGLADPWSASLVVPGDRVDVHLPADGFEFGAPVDGSHAGATSTVLAERAVVVRLLGEPPQSSGLLDAPGPASSGTALVVAVTAAEGRRLAAVAGRGVALTVPPPADAGQVDAPRADAEGIDDRG